MMVSKSNRVVAVVILVAAVIFTFGVFLGDITALLVIFGLGGFSGALYVAYLQSKIVGEVYNFGAWTGCGAMWASSPR
mgnify:CR=1 FL=1